MAIRVNFNAAAVLARSNLVNSDRMLSTSIERLSSGLRINRVADDPAGLTIANILRQDLLAVNEASTNAEEGINMLQTAEGALNEHSNVLLRMRELLLNAANEATTDGAQREALQAELDNLVQSLDQIAGSTRFGSQQLLDGSLAGNELLNGAGDVIDSIGFDATRLPGGVTENSTIDVQALSGDLQRESLNVTFLNGGVAAARTDAISGLTQDGTALTISGGESITLRGPEGEVSISLSAATTIGDLESVINAQTESTGLRANFNATTGEFSVESNNFGFGALDISTSDDLSGGTNIGLLDTDTTSTTANPLRPTRDTFQMTLVDPAGPAPAAANDTLAGLEGNSTALDAVAGGKLTIFGLGEYAEIDLTDSTTIQQAVDAINATVETTGAVASYDAITGVLSVEGSRGPLFVSSSDLTSGGLQVGLLDERTDLIDDVGTTQTAASANVTTTMSYVDADGTQRSVSLVQMPNEDGGLSLVNLLPGPEGESPWTAYETGAFNVTIADTSDGSFGSSVTAFTATQSAVRRSPVTFQVGPRTGDTIRVDIPDLRAGALGRGAGLAADGLANLSDLTSEAVIENGRSQEAIALVDAAIQEVSAARGDLGATQANGLERTLDSLRIASVNITESESRIRDVDMALESAEFAKQNIRLQAATSMLAQANQIPQSILQLLQ